MDGVIITQLRHIHNPKGNILHVMKKSDKGFGNFGEAYFSTINQNDIKGWKKHTKMTLNLVVPLGEVQFVIYDQYSENFFNIKLSPNNYKRLTVSPNLWLAFKGCSKYNLLLNIANVEHDPSEAINQDLKSIKYDW